MENFTIKFLNEEMMKKWAVGLEDQRKSNVPRISASPDNGAPEFAWNSIQARDLENPYLQQEEEDEEEDLGPATAPAQFPVPTTHSLPGHMPRTASSSNLRQRAGTGESQSLAGIARAPPPRFPIPPPPGGLSLQTQTPGIPSPSFRAGDSYFSPISESPASSRTSNASAMFANGYPFPKSGTPQPIRDDNNRYTAPAMPRAPSRDSSSPNPNLMNGRTPRGPSLPVMASQNQSAMAQQRSRSYSTPDINIPGVPRQRQPSQGNIPAVPGIPQHLHPAHDNNIPRSQTGSPRNDIPRANTQSPGAQRERKHSHQHSGSIGGTMAQFPTQPVYSRGNTPGPNGNPLRVDSVAANSRTVSPALGTGTIPPPAAASQMTSPDLPLPTQLKVRVNCDSGNYVTLVVGFNITYQSLIDRIDAKLARFTDSSIGKSMLKLRYRDEDGDFVTIESDDDIQIAFMEWREGVRNMYSAGVGEIELFCVGDTS